MAFNPSLVQITLVLLWFEQKGWTFTHFKKNPSGQIPEWQIPLKLLMDNINTTDFGDESVYKRVPPVRLAEALKRFVRTTMNKAKYQLLRGELGDAIVMLAVIAYYEKDDNFDDDADSVFAGFKDYWDELNTILSSMTLKLFDLGDRVMEWYREEFEKQSRGEKADFTLVWNVIRDVSGVDSPFERDDPRLWVFNDTERFISVDAQETYHDILPDELVKMWDLFMWNVVENAYQKLEEFFSFDESLDDIVEKWI